MAQLESSQSVTEPSEKSGPNCGIPIKVDEKYGSSYNPEL